MASRSTRLYKIASPSIRQRNQILKDYKELLEFTKLLEEQLNKVRTALVYVVKSEGSNLIPGRYSLILQNDLGEHNPTEYDEVSFHEGDGTVTMVVEDKRLKEDAGLKQQVEEFQKEMAQENAVKIEAANG